MNVVSVYTPQVGSEENDKKVFWREIDEVIQGIPGNKDRVFITWYSLIDNDMNGHADCERTGYEIIHKGYGFEDKNKAGGRMLELSYDLLVININFR